MRDKFPRASEMAMVKLYTQMGTFLKELSKLGSATDLVFASLRQLAQFTRESGERTNRWVMEFSSLCPMNLLKLGSMVIKLLMVK